MSRCLAPVFAALLLLTGVARALESTAPLSQAMHQTWQAQQGLPQNMVATILQSSDGHLYFGTQEGLARFDGVSWEVFDAHRGMPCSDVISLHEAADGALFIGTMGCGLVRYSEGRFVPVPGREGAQDERIPVLLPAADGTLWVGTNHGLARLKDGRLEFVPGLDSTEDEVLALAVGPGGVLWVGTPQGLVSLSDQGVKRHPPLEGAVGSPVTALLVDRAGALWVGTEYGGLWHAEGEHFRRMDFSPERITVLRADRAGALWVGTAGNGVWRMLGGVFEQVPEPALQYGHVLSLLEDREGTLWIGTYADGVHHLRERRIESIGMPEGLTDSVVWSVYEDREGAVWLGTESSGLNRYKDGRITRYTPAEGLPRGSVNAITQDREGNLWLASSAGLVRFDGKTFRRYTAADGLPARPVHTVFLDARGDLWIGQKQALVRYTRGQFTDYTPRDGIPSAAVNVLADAQDGGLWLGTPDGLVHFKDGRTRRVDLPSRTVGRRTLAIANDLERPDVLWVGTTAGLYRVEGGRAQAMEDTAGPLAEVVISLADDGRGNLWMGSNKGLFRATKSSLEAWARGEPTRPELVGYGMADGMRSAECNSASNSASLRTRTGELWFPTIAGAVRLVPERALRVLPPPAVVIQKVLSAGQAVSAEQGLSGFAPHVEFHFAAPTFVSPEKVRYRYWLEGFDKGWVDAETRRAAYYTNLPPGDYRFRVTAMGPGGVLLPTEASFAFRRHPRLVETGLFWAASTLVCFGLLLAGYRLRVHRLRARERELSQRVEERTRALAQANEDLTRAAHESAQSERNLRRLVNCLPTAIAISDQGRAIYANPAALELLGYDRLQDILGVELRVHCPEGERERMRSLQEDQSMRGTQLFEVHLARRDGSIRMVELGELPITFEGKHAQLMVARDITEARQMEARLRLSDRMASVGTLAAGVAHEINNPLAFVTSNLRYVSEQLTALRARTSSPMEPVQLDEMLRELGTALDEAQMGTSRVRHIVKDLKSFSRGSEDVNAPVDLHATLESALSMCHNEVRHRARLRKELGPVPRVLANEARLGQVFLNMVVNAAQSIREGAVGENEIRVATLTDASGWAVLEVQDTGCGIPPAILKRIFDPFFTTKPVGVGTGLGLSICHEIIQGVGGDIQVESEVGRGTLFRLRMPPAQVARVQEVADSVKPVTAASQSRAATKGRILVVDDEPLIARGLARLLRDIGTVEAVTDPRVALERLGSGERFDLIFCDVMMPEMSGQAVWEELGRIAPEQQARMVFITGGAFTVEARAFLESIPNATCNKPFEPAEMRELVHGWLTTPPLRKAG